MSKWLETLLESTKEAEAPSRYFYWSGLAAIASVIRKRIYLQRGPFYRLYPNIYVALVSSRSGLRKGIPIMVAKNLVSDLDSIRVISGCNSIQALIKELSMQKTFKSGAVVSEAQGLMISDEFESFITEDPRALTYLTALHNTHEHEATWEKRLKGTGLEELKSPCLTLLVASNEALFESMVKQKDIEGGFIARTFIVHESRRKRINDLLYSDEEIAQLLAEDSAFKEVLSSRLKKIAIMEGRFRLDSHATDFYHAWYEQLATEDNEDRTGAVDRLGDQVLKVAMLISISDEDDLIITEEHLKEAVLKSEECLTGTRKISLERNTSEISPLIEKVLKEFLRAPDQSITRKKLMINTQIEAVLMDRVIDTLKERGAIETPRRNSKKEIYYQMKREVYESYVFYKTAERVN